MANGYRIRVEAGRIEGVPDPSSGRSVDRVVAWWEVPPWTPEEERRFVAELAADPLLAGRWRRGAPTEADRRRAGADERSWRSGCGCGMRQPCRHAQSTLFQWRTEAKRDPWLWLTAAGVDPASLPDAIRKARAELAGRTAGEAVGFGPEPAAARASIRAAEVAKRRRLDPPAVAGAVEPAFWNRDVSFADWLRPLMEAARKKEGQHGDESDQAMDTNVRERV